ncbi:MAG: 30S ribosomal protein S20 [Armatimonadetes bacterium]|nr:30S ribosomal protein S20 [Armatimonadota bacterium]
MPRDSCPTGHVVPGGSGVAKRIKSGLKHLRKSAKRQQANAALKSRIKTLTRTALGKVEMIPVAQAELDKAAARGIIHPNAAARRKSRLMRRASASAATA